MLLLQIKLIWTITAVLNIQVTQCATAASFTGDGYEGMMCSNTLHSAATTALFWREPLSSHLAVKNACETLF